MVPEVEGSSPFYRPFSSHSSARVYPLSTFEAIILGIVQGLTEFLPVSSSGHLILMQRFLGLTHLDQYVLFNLVCHLGTLVAIVSVYFKELLQNRKRLLLIGLATLPLFPLVFVLKPIKALFNQPQFLGYFFLITALLLYLGMRFEKSEPPPEKERWKGALAIGLIQACAILPGVSRSGSTISCARILGWPKEEAVTFSFLLAIPTILGGVFLESFTAYQEWQAGTPIAPYVAGFFTSLIVGYGTLKLLIHLVKNNGLWVFVWYCTLLAVWTWT